VRIDHVVLAVGDLDAAAARLRAETGLASVPGGFHPGWGTANRIVPLGADYVELLSVVDPTVGAGSRLGRTLAALTEDGRDRWFSACLATSDIDATAARLGLTVEAGSRTRPDGTEVRWRGAGIEDPSRPNWLPFFIDWQMSPDQHPGRSSAGHLVSPEGISSVGIGGDAAAMRAWLGQAAPEIPLAVRDDGLPYGVRTVTVSVDGADDIVIEGAPSL